MNKRTWVRWTAAVTCVMGLAALPASAAPAREALLDEANPTYEWTDDAVLVTTGTNYANPRAMCDDPGFPCDDTLFQLAAPGKLRITTTATEDLPGGLAYRPDVDIYLYRSDADGTVGREVSRGETPEATETVQVAKAEPGYYLLRVAYFSGINVSYTGKASFTPEPPAPAQ